MKYLCAWCGADLGVTAAPDPDCPRCGGTGSVPLVPPGPAVAPTPCPCITDTLSHGICAACARNLDPDAAGVP